jgi:hypothetical protein
VTAVEPEQSTQPPQPHTDQPGQPPSGVDDLGTYPWVERTGGHLTRAERRRLVRPLAVSLAGNLTGRLAMLLRVNSGRRRHPTLGRQEPPDSALTRAALSVARARLGPALLNHSHRTFLFAAALGEFEGLDVDREVLCAAALLHDVGLSTREPLVDFTRASARAASLRRLGPSEHSGARSCPRHLQRFVGAARTGFGLGALRRHPRAGPGVRRTGGEFAPRSSFASDGRSMSAEVLRYAAFTADGRGGNPAGVVLDAESLTDAEMLAIARAIGYSETAFVIPTPEGAVDAVVRFFSPVAEVAFCGHATVATAVALAERAGPGRLHLSTRAGPTTVVTHVQDGDLAATLTSPPTTTRTVDESILAEALAALRWRPEHLDPRYPAH